MQDGQLLITDPRVEEYVLEIASMGGEPALPESLSDTLRIMEQTAQRLNYPIAGPYVGRTLYILTCLNGPKRIFDAGYGLGYSVAWIAAAAGAQAHIVTVATTEEHQVRAREFHRRAELMSQFDYRLGSGPEILESEPGPFDLIYSDVNKGDYPRMAKLAVDRLRPGGLYIADSCLWYGKVCSGTTTRDMWTASVDQHNQWILSQKSLFSTIIDQHEGLLIAVKRRE